VFAIDLRRVRGDEPEGIDLFVDDLLDAMDAFGLPSAAVLGLSFGGTLAMRLAAREPERVRALVLVNTLTRLDLSHVGLNRSLLIPLAYLTTRYAPRPIAETFARMWGDLQVWVYDPSDGNERVFYYQQTSAARVPFPDGTRRLALLRPFDLRDGLPAVRAPALVVRGMTDTYCPESWAREIAALIPQADFLEIAGAGHLALISKAETFNRVVLRWLREHVEDA
jgi:pimeloyl-ACP methyl ester carboxylesterase